MLRWFKVDWSGPLTVDKPAPGLVLLREPYGLWPETWVLEHTMGAA